MSTLTHEYPLPIGARRVGVYDRTATADQPVRALPYLLVVLAIVAAAWGWTLLHGGLPPSLFG